MKLLLLLLLAIQDEPVSQTKVDNAIDRGARYLLSRLEKGLPKLDHFNHKGLTRRDLVLYALVYAGIDQTNPVFAKALKEMVDEPLVADYGASMQALVLEAHDPLYYQGRIAQCAQFLVDNQCENGQWFYGKEVPLDTWTPPTVANKGTKALKRIVVQRRKGQGEGRKSGDNSNTQYALLGLRACLESSIDVPRETLLLAEQWWTQQQNKDGGWDYDCYDTRADHSYGGMTCGAVGSLAICKYYLKKDYKRDPAIQRGLKWLERNFTVSTHAAFSWGSPDGGKWHYYYLYGIERAGILCETEKFGPREWYPEGAKWLLDAQKEDGSWVEGKGDAVTDTAFAILFLRRATKPLKPVPTVDNKKEK